MCYFILHRNFRFMIYSYINLSIWLDHCKLILYKKSWIYIFSSFKRASGAWCNSVDVDSKLEVEERTISAEYTLKLVNENCVIPDPVSLKDVWLKESDNKKGDGILQWFSTDYLDIPQIIIGLTQPDFLKRLQSDYRQGKCYWYFTCEFFWEVLYHPITAASKLHFLKCKLVLSHWVKSKPYNVWALIENNNKIPGGNVKSAYCSCVVDLVGTCSNVVSMLFCIEHAQTFRVTCIWQDFPAFF